MNIFFANCSKNFRKENKYTSNNLYRKGVNLTAFLVLELNALYYTMCFITSQPNNTTKTLHIKLQDKANEGLQYFVVNFYFLRRSLIDFRKILHRKY